VHYVHKVVRMKRKGDQYELFSLFSGCGGLDLGFTGLEESKSSRLEKGRGFYSLFANDIYTPSCRSYQRNFGAELIEENSKICKKNHICLKGDITKVDFKNCSKNPDVITGGFPCQDFSMTRGGEQNGRGGIKVKRGKLYCHFVRALSHFQPPLFVAENVKGLISANKGEAYKTIKEDFRNLNNRWDDVKQEYKEVKNSAENPKSYELILSEVLNFADFGVPQNRERLIIIGLRKDLYSGEVKNLANKVIDELEKPDEILRRWPLTPLEVFEGKHLGNLQEEYEKIMGEYGEHVENPETEYQKNYKENIWSKYSFDIWDDYIFVNRSSPTKPFDFSKSDIIKKHKKVLDELGYLNDPLDSKEFPDGSNEIMREQDRIKERMARIPPDENFKFVEGTEHSVKGFMSNVYKRIHPLKPAYTVIARGGGGTWGYHYRQNRQKMTNRERARLQTYPDNFYFEGKNGEVRRQIGEAVPPRAGYRIAGVVRDILDELDL